MGCASSQPELDDHAAHILNGPAYSVDIYKLASNDEVDAVAEELRNHPERLNYLCKTLKQTCLMVACCASSLMTATLLIDQYDVDVNMVDDQGRTALFHVCLSQRESSAALQLVSMMIKRGADINHKDTEGISPLMIIASQGNAPMLVQALNEGAIVNDKDRYGCTALMRAVREGYASTARILVERMADVNATDSQGTTAIMIACSGGYLDIARMLVSMGKNVDLSLQDSHRRTALDHLHNTEEKKKFLEVVHARGGGNIRLGPMNGSPNAKTRSPKGVVSREVSRDDLGLYAMGI